MAKCALVSAEAAIWSARIAFTFSSGVCMRAIQTGKSILKPPRPANVDGEARAAERVQPLRARVVANMGMVAQQFDRLQMRVEQRLARSIDIDERRSPAAFQRAARFPKPGVEVAPVMGGESAGDKVERLVFKRRCSAGACAVSMLLNPFSRAVRATAANISEDKSVAMTRRAWRASA